MSRDNFKGFSYPTKGLPMPLDLFASLCALLHINPLPRASARTGLRVPNNVLWSPQGVHRLIHSVLCGQVVLFRDNNDFPTSLYEFALQKATLPCAYKDHPSRLPRLRGAFTARHFPPSCFVFSFCTVISFCVFFCSHLGSASLHSP